MAADRESPPSAEKHERFPLGAQVLTALVLGIFTGLFFGELAASLEVVGVGFIRLLQITVIPYITVALITGLGRLESADVRQLLLKGGAVLLALWAIAITVVSLLELSFPDWPTRSLFQKSSLETAAPPDFLQLYIPSNPFFSLANGIVPAVVVFSVLIGISLSASNNKAALIEPLSLFGEVLSRITSFVARLSPVGVFALMANMVGTMSFSDLARLQVYVVIMVLLLAILGLWILPGLVSSLTPVGHRQLLQRLRAPLITAFATGSSLVVLPMLTEICKELVAESRKAADEDGEVSAHEVDVIAGLPEDEASEPEEPDPTVSSVGVLIPAFYSFPTVGNVMTLGFVIFAGWYIGAPVSGDNYPTVIGAGIVSLFGGPSLAIPFTLGLAELPRDLFQVFLSIDVIVSRFTTFVSAMHYSTIALVGTFAIAGLIRPHYWRLTSVAVIGVLLVGVSLLGVRAFYSHVVVVPYTMDEYLRGLRNLRDAGVRVVHKEFPVSVREHPRSVEEITSSGVLRACYSDGNYPLSFFNRSEELVGFDIEMAHSFAGRLGVDLEFLPVQGDDDLVNGYCDVLFNSQVLALDRATRGVYTEPYDKITLAFIVPAGQRDEYFSWRQIRQRGDLEVSLTSFQNLQREVVNRLPDATPVPIDSFVEQQRYFESESDSQRAFLDSAEEGAAWTVLYPQYTVVVPRPVVQLPVAYMVASDNTSLLGAMNEWLRIEQATGDIEEIYDYWVQGKTQQSRPPRWSVVRDVLGWIE